MQSHLRIGAGLERVARQLALDITEVVDLAVDRNRDPPLGAQHRLSSQLREIENAEPAVAHVHMVVRPLAPLIRPPMREQVKRLPSTQAVTVVQGAPDGDETEDPTHQNHLVSRLRVTRPRLQGAADQTLEFPGVIAELQRQLASKLRR